MLLTIRLAVAYRLYLRFQHAAAAVIASQVIVWLVLLKLTLDCRFIWLFQRGKRAGALGRRGRS